MQTHSSLFRFGWPWFSSIHLSVHSFSSSLQTRFTPTPLHTHTHTHTHAHQITLHKTCFRLDSSSLNHLLLLLRPPLPQAVQDSKSTNLLRLLTSCFGLRIDSFYFLLVGDFFSVPLFDFRPNRSSFPFTSFLFFSSFLDSPPLPFSLSLSLSLSLFLSDTYTEAALLHKPSRSFFRLELLRLPLWLPLSADVLITEIKLPVASSVPNRLPTFSSFLFFNSMPCVHSGIMMIIHYILTFILTTALHLFLLY